MKRFTLFACSVLVSGTFLPIFGETYDEWATRQSLTATERPPQLVLTSDGIPNVWKYVLAADPKMPAPNSPLLPVLTTNAGASYFGIQFTRNRAAEGVQYGLSASDDLRTWRDIEAVLERVQDQNDEKQTVRLASVHSVGDTKTQYYRSFIRLNSRAVTLLTGPRVLVSTRLIPSRGGEVVLDNSAGPLSGMTLTIPDGAYSNTTQVLISYRPILENPLSSKIAPATPLITIENGGEYSEEPMSVRVPLQVTTNEFAMGFLYDTKTGQFEGLPIESVGADHITVSTHHFSSFVVSVISKKTLPGSVDSGFAPGIDDWEFVNDGSYLSPNGHCSGQSLSAMWYYCEERVKDAPPLNGCYDNSLYSFPTPQVNLDNVLGYTLASKVQIANKMFWNRFFSGLQNDAESTYLAFKYSIWVTHEPQYVSIWGAAGGHAMVIYGVSTNTLKVADPNYPGNPDRKIVFDPQLNKLETYFSGLNAGDLGVAFTNMFYMAKTAKVNWSKLGTYWTELTEGSILQGMPEYGVAISEDAAGTKEIAAVSSWHPTEALIQTELPAVYINCTNANFDTGQLLLGTDGKKLPAGDFRLDLNLGLNRVGVGACRKRVIQTTNGPQNTFDWLGFTWLNIERNGKDLSQPFSLKVYAQNFLHGACALQLTYDGTVFAPPASIIRVTTNLDSWSTPVGMTVTVFRRGSTEPVDVTFTPNYDLILRGEDTSADPTIWTWKSNCSCDGFWNTTATNPRIKIGNLEDRDVGTISLTVPGGQEFNQQISLAFDFHQTLTVKDQNLNDQIVQTYDGSGASAVQLPFLKVTVVDF